MVELIDRVLKLRGYSVKTCIRDSNRIGSRTDKIRAFATGVYSPSAKREVAGIIREWTPDVVHVHNLYPLFSPSVLEASQEAHVPVVMSVHNYRLTCPISVHFRNGQNCQLCIHGNAYHCLVGNCAGDPFTSAGYAFRNTVARMRGQFSDHVNLFLAVSGFVRNKMIEGGYDPQKIDVLENGVPLPQYTSSNLIGGHVAYVGRMREEKGVETLLKVARRLPACKFMFVGDGPERARWEAASTANCSFLGRQDSAGVEEIYRTARLVVVPSLWWEPFGLVVVEAMSHGRAVVAAQSGAIPELVTHGTDGLLFPPETTTR